MNPWRSSPCTRGALLQVAGNPSISFVSYNVTWWNSRLNVASPACSVHCSWWVGEGYQNRMYPAASCYARYINSPTKGLSMLRLRPVAIPWKQHTLCLPSIRLFSHTPALRYPSASLGSMDRVNTTPRLAELRKLMKENNISAYSESILEQRRVDLG